MFLFAFLDQARIKPETRIVEKDVAVYFPYVNLSGMARDDGACGGFKIKRDVQVLGKVVESTQWQHAERLIGVD